MWVQTDCQVCSTDRLILDLILLEGRLKIHWRRQIRHFVYGISTQDQKILPTVESSIPDKYTKFLHVWSLRVDTICKCKALTPWHLMHLGWEFQFLVPISGTPIGSGIPIPFLIAEIPVGFFFEFRCWKIDKSEFRFQNSEFKKKLHGGTQYTSFCTRKAVAPIPTSTQKSCRHTYICSKWLPPYLHLLKTVAATPTSTQHSCCHTYIYSTRLLPYLHLLKTVAAIPTSTQKGCRHTYIYFKKRWEHFPIHEIGRIGGRRGFWTSGKVLRIGGNTFYDEKKLNTNENSRVEKVRNWNNCGIRRSSKWISQPSCAHSVKWSNLLRYYNSSIIKHIHHFFLSQVRTPERHRVGWLDWDSFPHPY